MNKSKEIDENNVEKEPENYDNIDNADDALSDVQEEEDQ